MKTSVKTVILCILALQVRGDSCPYDGELTAGSTASLTIFNQSLPEAYDRLFNSHRDGLECTWTIEASSSSKTVRLNFLSFHLRNTTSSRNGDCVAIYDGDHYDTDDDHLIQELCDRMPESVYNSTDVHLTVVFRQGGSGGPRWFTMNYTMVASDDTWEDALDFLELIKDIAVLVVIGIVVLGAFRIARSCCKRDTGGNLLGCLRRCLRGSTRRSHHTSVATRQRRSRELDLSLPTNSRRASSGSFDLSLEPHEMDGRDDDMSLAMTMVPLAEGESMTEDLSPADGFRSYTIASDTDSASSDPELVLSASPLRPGSWGQNETEDRTAPPPSYDSLFK